MGDSLYQFVGGDQGGGGGNAAAAVPWQDATAANTPAMPAGADPFGGAGDNGQPGFLQRAGNFLQTPQAQSAFENLTRFGAATLAAANARTPQGFLAYGNGFGPVGEGLLQAGQIGRQQQALQGELAQRQAQTQGQLIQNQLTGLQIPFMKQQMALFGQLGANGGLIPPPPGSGDQGQGGASGSGPLPSVSPSSASGGRAGGTFTIPESARSSMLAQATNGTPVPPQLVNAVIQHESGWDAGATGSGGDIGLGQVLPSTAQNPGFGMSGVDPASITGPGGAQRNVNFTAQYLYNRGKAAGLSDADWQNPQKWPIAIAAYHSGVDNPRYVNSVMAISAGQNQQQQEGQQAAAPQQQQAAPLPGIGAPGTGMMTPQQAATYADRLDERAALLGMTQYGKGASTVLSGMAREYRQYALAGPQAGAVAQAQVGPGIQKAAGIAQAEVGPHLQEAWGKPMTMRGPGSAVINPATGQVIAQSPVEVPSVDASGAPGHTFVRPMESTPGTVGSPGTFIPSGLNPKAKEFQEERGKGLGEVPNVIDEQAAAAFQDNFRWDQMRRESLSWDMGKFASSFGEANSYLQATAQAFNIKTPGLDQKVGDYQAFNKNAGQILREAVKQTSSRASTQEYKLISESLPQAATSRQAFGQIADQMQGLDDFAVAKQKFYQDYMKSHNDPEQFNVTFNSTLTPGLFLVNRLNQTPEGQQALQGMLGNMAKTPAGQLAAKQMMERYVYASRNGYFDQTSPAIAPAAPVQAPGGAPSGAPAPDYGGPPVPGQ